MPDQINHKDFEAILADIMSGKRELPNAVDIDLAKGVAAIACGAGLGSHSDIRNAKLPSIKLSYWARYFLNTTQGGQLDGSGYAMVWGTPGGKIYEFAICRHENSGGGTPEQNRRGWYPGRCSKCGLDMSVDSGD